MSHRTSLPQLEGDLFLTDGGIETSLIFHHGLDLPEFAAFVLLDDDEGIDQLRRYYEPYLALARESGAGFVLESPTWRASPDWAARLGLSAEKLDSLNRRAIELMEELRGRAGDAPVVISGCVGPQGDGYRPVELLSASAARDYHSTQIGTFAETVADMVTALTMTYADEAIGVAQAARDAGTALGHLLHPGDGRAAAEWPGPRRGDRRGGRGDGRSALALHDQLRPSHAFRGRSGH